MPSTSVNLDALQAAVARAVVEGNKELVAAFLNDRDKRHDLRNRLQEIVGHVSDHDGELKFIKGVIVTLVGNGDGSSGMVPRLEKDMKLMGEDIANLASDVRYVTTTLNVMADNVRTLLEKQEKSTGFMAGFSGAKVALTIIGTIITILAFLIGRGFHI